MRRKPVIKGGSAGSGRSAAIVRLLIPTVTGLAVLVLVLSQLEMFQRCVGPVKVPSPRKEPWWLKYHAQLAQELKEADQEGGFDVLLMGDSILATYEHTFPTIFDKYFNSSQQSAKLLAIGGDEVAHLHWRLMNGEMLHYHPPKAIVVLIGTNDLGAASCGKDEAASITAAANGTVDRVADMLRYTKAHSPNSHIILVGLLPRGEARPPDPAAYHWPSVFTPAIQHINTAFRDLAAANPRITFVDCSSKFLLGGKEPGINAKLVPDGLHPATRDGMALLAQCITPAISEATHVSVLGNWLG